MSCAKQTTTSRWSVHPIPALGQILGKSSQAILFKPQSIRIDIPQTPELLQVRPGDAACQDKVDVEAVVLLSILQDIYVFGIQAQAGYLRLSRLRKFWSSRWASSTDAGRFTSSKVNVANRSDGVKLVCSSRRSAPLYAAD